MSAPITETTLQAIRDNVLARNEIYRKFAQQYQKTTWDEVAYNVKTGKAHLLYGIGDELICNYRYYANNNVDFTDYEFPWVVADFRDVEWEDGTIHPGMILQAKHCTIESVQFDAPEREACDSATETTAQEGLYYFAKDGSTYTALNLQAGDQIPYGEHDAIYKDAVDNVSVVQNGYNNYKLSAQRQWLNSAGDRGEWWQPTHIGDTAPSQANQIRGFLNGLDDDLIAVVNPVKIQVARNTVTDGGGIDVMYDKFFLPSIEEMYGAPQLAGAEGEYFEYWKQKTGLDAPTNNANNGRIITGLENGTAQTCRLRSAYRGYVDGAWIVSTAGTLYNISAYYAYRCAPACVIS